MSPEDVDLEYVLKDQPEEGYWQACVSYTGTNNLTTTGVGVSRKREKAVAFALQNLANKLKD